MSSVKTLLKFELLLKKYNSVYRDLASIHTTKIPDNDIEHSYRVAMLCWMIIDEYKLKLDTNRVIRYALIHDLPEVYAGDVSIYAKYSQKDKERKESKAIRKLEKQFTKQKTLWKDLNENTKNAKIKKVNLYI